MDEMRVRTVVDEDWKARVQREKELSRKGTAAETPTAATAPEATEESAAPAAAETPAPDGEISPAFEGLVNTLATQVMFCLGFIAPPGQPSPSLNLEQAKESLEMLMVVEEKTQGNLNAQEATLLNETVAELQRLFAARVQQVQAEAMQRAGIDPTQLRGEEPS